MLRRYKWNKKIIQTEIKSNLVRFEFIESMWYSDSLDSFDNIKYPKACNPIKWNTPLGNRHIWVNVKKT